MLTTEPVISEQDAVRRLVQRLGLGPRPGELGPTGSGPAGFEAVLASLTAAGPDSGATATPPPAFDPPAPKLRKKTATVEQRMAQRRELATQGRRLGVWWLDRMTASTAPFAERMTWFWHTHFATSIQKVQLPRLMYQQNDTQRRLGRGDFRPLAQAMITDPAMLIWLDGNGNQVGKPNENLAREFMELFSLGVGNYTEQDVREAARALTGWRVDFSTDAAVFKARRHDAGPETVLGHPAAYTAPDLVDLLVREPASPRYLAGRIWTRFVSDTPPDPATMDRLLAAYGPGHDITALVTGAVRSPAFTDPASVLVREPVLWLAGALRTLRLPASEVPPKVLQPALNGMGQVPFRPPSVGGWPAGVPWLTTAAALVRMRLAQRLAALGNISSVTATAPSGRIDATAALLGLPRFTDRTATALAPLVNHPAQLVGLALAAPENTVST